LFEIKQLIYDDNIKSYGNLTPIIDLFVTQLGYSPLGSGWKEVNQVEAKKILSLIMTKNLAYFVEIMTLHEAEQILVKLFNFFPDNSQFFTNASFASNYTGISQWNSITKATFDTGVVIVNPRHIGILWVEDED
jgi:hypothetical protein